MRFWSPLAVCIFVPGFVPLQEKLNYFWIVEKKKIEDLKASLRNKEREAQDIEEKHQVEVKVRARRPHRVVVAALKALYLHARVGLQATHQTLAVRAPG